MTGTVITEAMVKKALAVYRDNHGWIAECRMERALSAAAPMILEAAATALEQRAESAARFVREREHLMHPMRCPSDELKAALKNYVAEDRKFRQAATIIRTLKGWE
jgi:hypothetical protein